MKNSDYWKQRFTQLENAQNAMAASSLTDIEKQYRQAQKQIEAQISTWYQRFAKNNGITMAEARQWLTGKDLKEFHWSVQDYIQYGQDNAITGQWMKELENASAKLHISKLEALKIHTENSLQTMFAQQQQTISGVMGDVFTSGYYHTAYELQHGFNIGFDISAVDQSYLEKVLAKPWAVDGYNFSDRIWTNKSKLISELHGELSRGIMTGSDPQKAIDAIAAKMNTSKSNAGRLVMTEEAYFSSAAQKKCFDDLDVEKYEIVATLDSHTSDICQSLDGQIFSMKDFEAGVTAPPFHPNCRSTTAPAFDEDFGQIGERAARDENGETYYVPDNMKYPEWKKAFVDGDKSGFDAGTQMGGATAYTHHKEPEAPKDPTFSDKTQTTITESGISGKRKNSTSQNTVDLEYLKSDDFKRKFTHITENEEVNKQLYKQSKAILTHRNGTDKEDMCLISAVTGEIVGLQTTARTDFGVEYNKSIITAIDSNPQYSLISLHNHPTNNPPTGNDLVSNGANRYKLGVVVTHSGRVFWYRVGKKTFTANSFNKTVDKYRGSAYNLNEADAICKALSDFEKDYGIEWGEM